MKKLILAIIILFFAVGQAIATNYYVRNGGSDAAAGTTGAPWETIAKVNSTSFSAGDDVYFKCDSTWTNEELKVDWSGVDGDNHVIIGAYYGDDGSEVIGVSGAKPKFVGSRVAYYPYYSQHTTADNSADLVETETTWVVDALIGLEVYNVTKSEQCTITDNTADTVICALSGGEDWDIGNYYRIGSPIPDEHWNGIIELGSGQSYITVQDISIDESSFYGIEIVSDDFIVTRCDISDTNTAGIQSISPDAEVARGPIGGSKLSQISYNTITRAGSYQNLMGDWTAVLGVSNGRHTWIHHNDITNSYGEGILVYNQTATTDLGDATIEYNVILNSYMPGIYLSNAGYNIVRFNKIYGDGNSVANGITDCPSYTYGNRCWYTGGIVLASEDHGSYIAEQVQSNIIYGNTIMGRTTGIYFNSQFADGDDSWSDNLIFNNTTYGNLYEVNFSVGAQDAFEDAGASGNIIKNNIFMNSIFSTDELLETYLPASGLTWDYNLWSAAVGAGATGANDPTPSIAPLTDVAITLGSDLFDEGKGTFGTNLLGPVLDSGDAENNEMYRIETHTDADFTTIGAPNNDPGTYFWSSGTSVANGLDAGDSLRKVELTWYQKSGGDNLMELDEVDSALHMTFVDDATGIRINFTDAADLSSDVELHLYQVQFDFKVGTGDSVYNQIHNGDNFETSIQSTNTEYETKTMYFQAMDTDPYIAQASFSSGEEFWIKDMTIKKVIFPTDASLIQGSSECFGALSITGYNTRLDPTSSWPDDVRTRSSNLSIGAYECNRGSALP